MEKTISQRVDSLKRLFRSGATKPVKWRVEQLKRFKQAIINHQTQIEEALWSDLHKSPEEAYITEIAIVLQELDLHIAKLKKWAKPQRVSSPLHLLPSQSYLYHEPLGVALIIAPWNYPIQLILNPLVGAISAGCCAMLKPSPAAPATGKVVEMIVREAFANDYVDIVHGGRVVNGELLKEDFDLIFFTGSPELARVVSLAAAETLTPMILELGGKSPCVVDRKANLKIAARRIAWGKWLNAGQTCIAPDYLLVDSEIKEQLIELIKVECAKLYGDDVAQSRFFPRIVNHGAFDRLVGLLDGETLRMGGDHNRDDKYIAPTILDNITFDSKVMQEEIFGPLLPVLTYENLDDAIAMINDHPKPLALYYFGDQADKVLSSTTSGGACINDTIMHISNHNLPFGGVGRSGMGSYHGKQSYLQFSNCKGVVKTPTWIDIPLKYPPFKYFKLLKKII